MTVLISGGAGYIGSHTAVALHQSGYQIVMVDNFSNSSPKAVDAVRALTSKEVNFVEADLCDPLALERVFQQHKVSDVLHFAAHKTIAESFSEPLKYYRNNLTSLLNLLTVMEQYEVQRLVYSSSCAVYGQPKKLPVGESSPQEPNNPYARTKLIGEQIIKDVCSRGSLAAIMLRYFNPVGGHKSGHLGEHPNNSPNNLAPLVMQAAMGKREKFIVHGDDYDTRDGSGVRDYVHVVDLAEAHVSALARLRKGHCGAVAVNVGTGKPTSVFEVIDAAQKACGTQINQEISKRRAGDVAAIWATTDAAEELLDWRAKRDINEMMVDHWRWQTQHPEGYI